MAEGPRDALVSRNSATYSNVTKSKVNQIMTLRGSSVY